MPARMRKMLALAACLLLLLVFFGQGWACLRYCSPTFDEAAYLASGYAHLARGDFRLMPEHPPLLKELAALPVFLWYRLPFEPDPTLWEQANYWRIGQDFLYGSPVPAEQILTTARLPNLLLGTLLVALVGWWSYRLWGEWAAVVGTALAALEPNLVAHAALVGTDLGTTLFVFGAVYLLWEALTRRSGWLLVAVGAVTGLALASKFTAVLLPVMLALVTAGCVLLGEAVPLPGRALPRTAVPFGRRVMLAGVGLMLVLAVAALALQPFYFFHGFGAWWQGFVFQMGHRASGHDAFFFGEYSREGWWTYFAAAFLLKTPIGSLVLIAASLVFWSWGRPLTRRELLFLLLPAVLFFLAVTWTRVNLGLRYVLPVYPFLFVLASRLATIPFRARWATPLLVGIPLVLTGASVLRVLPHQLAYFNEFAGGPSEGHRYLSDSNLDWGQDLKGLKAYMDREQVPMVCLCFFGTAPPEEYDIRYQYVPCVIPATHRLRAPSADLLPLKSERELLAISRVNLQGIYLEDKETYAWLGERHPVARIGYSILVFDLTNDPEGQLALARVYQKAGNRAAAVAECHRVQGPHPGIEWVSGLDRLFGLLTEADRLLEELQQP